jgi:hypothetical protein
MNDWISKEYDLVKAGMDEPATECERGESADREGAHARYKLSDAVVVGRGS